MFGPSMVSQALAASDPEGGKEIFAVDKDEAGKELNLFVWNGYDADAVLNPFRKSFHIIGAADPVTRFTSFEPIGGVG